MYFKECKYCGAYLDPGESCDCKREEAAPEQREQPQAQKPIDDTNRIAPVLDPVKGGHAYGPSSWVHKAEAAAIYGQANNS